mmetsp:Transcript_13663/g.15326  ORF Transcript_13663/g.15326 Transcript_13663/m.15326 type:complete len:252 (-) Transcript_13663:43-798(-)
MGKIFKKVKKLSRSNQIDNPDNLEDSRVFIFSGSLDSVVVPDVVQKTQRFYRRFLADVTSIFDFPINHTMPTVGYGQKCDQATFPLIGKCGFNGALVSLQQIYPEKDIDTAASYNPKNLFTLGQNTTGTTMGANAYVYAPLACQDLNANCSLHVVFHACGQSIEYIGLQYVEKTGYNEVAEASNLVILYPQATIDPNYNPLGCWDFWGYTNEDYVTKSGIQIAEVERLITTLKDGSADLLPAYPERMLKSP